MTRYYRAHLSRPPTTLNVGDGSISLERAEWVQPHDRWSMFLYETGGLLNVGMRVYPFSRGSVSLIPPGYRCGHDKVWGGTACKWYTFDLPGEPRDPVALPVMTHLSAERYQTLLDRHEDMVTSIDRTISRAAAFVWDVLWGLSRPPDVLRSSLHLYDAEAYIREHLSQNLRVEAIAQTVGVSQTHLLRLFRLEHGATVQQFIRDLRINEARRLLTTTGIPIKEIAHRVGISDPQHFNKVIRWNTGYSPTQLRSGFTNERSSGQSIEEETDPSNRSGF